MSNNREATAVKDTSAKSHIPSVYDTIRDEVVENNTKNVSPTKFEQLSEKKYSGKRTIDILCGTIAFLFFLVSYPFIALGIKLSSKGPVLFKQKRTGQNGKEFICYKFRTMHQVNLRRIDGKPVVTQKGDKRIFFFGSLLRMTNLDELPQIINVFKGDMSLVGPRPYAVNECRHWNSTFEDHYYRYSVKPGVTGLAQINGLRGGTHNEELMRQRLDKDLVYVQKQSLSFDLYILLHTILQMLKLETNAH